LLKRHAYALQKLDSSQKDDLFICDLLFFADPDLFYRSYIDTHFRNTIFSSEDGTPASGEYIANGVNYIG
jgi:hypothetical protein